MVQALRDDVKDFCHKSAFSNWAKIRKFVNFGGLRVSEIAGNCSQNVHISMYLVSVHVDLVI